MAALSADAAQLDRGVKIGVLYERQFESFLKTLEKRAERSRRSREVAYEVAAAYLVGQRGCKI